MTSRDLVTLAERALAHRIATGDVAVDVVLAVVDPDDLRSIDARAVIRAAAELAADGGHVARATLWPAVGSSPLDACERASADLAHATTDALVVAVSTATAARIALRAIGPSGGAT